MTKDEKKMLKTFITNTSSIEDPQGWFIQIVYIYPPLLSLKAKQLIKLHVEAFEMKEGILKAIKDDNGQELALGLHQNLINFFK